MKGILLIGALILGLGLNAQELMQASKPVTANQDKFSGEYITYFDNGNVKSSVVMVNGVADGAYFSKFEMVRKLANGNDTMSKLNW
jgi:hypothetical protein